MEKPAPQIAKLVRELRAKLNDGKAPRIPWGFYDDILASRNIDPASFEHVGYFHAAVAGAIGSYDEVLAEYVGNNEGAFRQYCKERGLNAEFQGREPNHW